MRPLKFIGAISNIVAALVLAACQSTGPIEIPKKEVDYKSAGKLPSLEVL